MATGSQDNPDRSRRTRGGISSSGQISAGHHPSGKTSVSQTPTGRTAVGQTPSLRTPGGQNPSGRTPSAKTLTGTPGLSWSLRIGLPSFVAVAAVVVFLPAISAEFVNWDDDKVLLNNPNFRGFTERNLHWMFTAYKMGHYHPLAWLSYALDHAVSKALLGTGLDPRVYHASNIIWHAGAAVAFYFLALRLYALACRAGGQLASPAGGTLRDQSGRAGPAEKTGSSCASPDLVIGLGAALAALLFACHPLRVETVAWVTERRDVLSTLFLLGSLICYLGYAGPGGRPAARAALYAGALACLTLSLLSKAWGITVPLVLLVLDAYPLDRLRVRNGRTPNALLRIVLLEKLPFYVLALVFALKAHAAQAAELDTMKTWAEWGLADRLAQAAYGLFFYSFKTLVPTGLTPIVEIPVNNNPLGLRYLMAALVVSATVGILLVLRKRWPAGLALAAGYAITLSPVLGFAQSGPQLVADRYSYVACLTWALLAGAVWVRLAQPGLPGRDRRALLLFGLPPAALVILLGTLTWRQTRIWQNSRTLWEHAVRLDPLCVMARTNLGLLERQAGNRAAAIAHYQAALAVKADDPILLNNLAVAMADDPQERDAAIVIVEKAIALQPANPDLWRTLGGFLKDAGRLDEALPHLQECVRLKPRNPPGQRALADCYWRMKAYSAAVQHYRLALEQERALNPRSEKAVGTMLELAKVLLASDQAPQALQLYEQVVAMDPNNKAARQGAERARRGGPK